jgi:hypothetical protein
LKEAVMSRKPRAISLAFLVLAAAAGFVSCRRPNDAPGIVIDRNAAGIERFAAAELRRYLYLRTGLLARITERDNWTAGGRAGIIVALKNRPLVLDPKGPGAAKAAGNLRPEEYVLRTVDIHGTRSVLIAAADGPGLLYGTYRFLNLIGIGFGLEGDVIPDERIASFTIPDLDETGRPLFAVRGIQPFHDFPEGPDWWSVDNYKAILGQLPKLGMNFFGLHTYPEKAPNAEPTVWIGEKKDHAPDGRVLASYPASYQNSLRGNWGYEPMKTGDYPFGASLLFERDDYGNDVMEGLAPEPKTAGDSDEAFNRAGRVLREAFTFARSLGIKTCVGTEIPLTVPDLVRARLKARGQSLKNADVVKDIYRGIFSRIAAAYPVDYYWFWTPEGWTWSDASPEAVKETLFDLSQAALAHAEEKSPFALATCGWVLGPPSARTLFDRFLPKSIAVSTINREVGKAPVDPGFARISGRSKWAIPWLEDDPSLTSPQLWAGRMRRDAADALRYGCDGLLGIHWRTDILSPNVLALSQAAWDQSWSTLPRNPEEETGPTTGQFVTFKDRRILGTSEEAVYRDVRDRVFAYRIPVPDGTYSVTLKFCEGEIGKKGGRVFDVLIQGRKVAEAVDVFARAGLFKAFDLEFSDIAVAGGRLVIEFADRIHYPAIAAIVVRGGRYLKKINCGGPAVLGYEPDGPETVRSLPVLDLYRDWARIRFGTGPAEENARAFSALDGRHPVPVTWTNGPGGIVPNPKAWGSVAPEYRFVDEFEAIRPRITGRGNLERFDFWLNHFKAMRETARFTCLWGEYDAAMARIRSVKGDQDRSRLAAESALPVRIRMVAAARSLIGYFLASVGTTGEMGTLMNWAQHNFPMALGKPGEELAALLGGRLPEEAKLPLDYSGPGRVFAAADRTSLEPGEDLRLKIIVLSSDRPTEVELCWRELGKGPFREVPLSHVARGVYAVTLPAPNLDLEYYVRAVAGGREVLYPSTAPDLNRTVVMFRK